MSQNAPTEERAEVAYQLLTGYLQAHRLDHRVVLARSRSKPLDDHRRRIYVLLHDAGLSTPEIGWLMHRDHSTVVHALHVAIRKAAA